MGLDLQCCLAGNSKRAPRIFILSIVLCTEYLSYVKSIAIYAPTFFGYIISVFASVSCHRCRNRGIGEAHAPPPQFLADQLLLSEPGRAYYAHHIITCPPPLVFRPSDSPFSTLPILPKIRRRHFWMLPFSKWMLSMAV